MYKHILNLATEKALMMGINNPMVGSSKDVVNYLDSAMFAPEDIEQLYMVSFDFSSLYTSISNRSIYQMIIFFGTFLDLDMSLVNIMMDLHNFIKSNAYFTVAGKQLFLQKNGLAMGSYDSCDGANLVLFKAELDILQHKNIMKHIKTFFRFIDDGCLIMKGEIGGYNCVH